MAQALPGRGSRGPERRAATGRSTQGNGGVLRAVGAGGPPPSAQPGAAVLAVDLAAAGRLHGRANRHPGGVRDRPGASEGSRYRTQSSAAHHHESGPRVCPQKKAIEETRDDLGAADVFYYADEFNLSWMPTLKAMWSPKGQQVMIPTPAQPKKRYGIGALDYHTGETVILIRRRKRRRETAELLEALLEKHPRGTVYVAWDNSNTHEDDEVEAVLRGAAGRLVLLYLPTYSPWLNPIEMLWRHFRREVTHCELFENIKALVVATHDFFDRYNRCPWRILSIIGAPTPQELRECT